MRTLHAGTGRDSIAIADFDDFFHSANGYAPFPWQQRLATKLCETGRWPELLDLPTGTGKTACIDIAVFHLAFELANGRERQAPMRIAWVVDRRLIVDDAFERGQRIARLLCDAKDGILKTMASVLRRTAGKDEQALVAARLRGGVPQEGDWARTPTQPTILSSTVDQVGSRLLFRGYGISRAMRPIHAGLLGEDTLVILDEVHLSEPFRQTLDRVSHIERRSGMPWQFVQLSATPRELSNGAAFTLDDEDFSNEALERRRTCPKPARLVRIGRVGFGSSEHAERFADEALKVSVLGMGSARNTLIVVNRVDLARRIFSSLREKLVASGGESPNLLTLLIGRARELDKQPLRDLVVERCRSRATGDPDVETNDDPLIVVATQCIEAGADLDFDALVTEIASLDALRQRFGRLNRMGRPIGAHAAILAVDAEIAASAKPDPIYGFAARDTWAWLHERAKPTGGSIDFASSKLDVAQVDAATLEAMRSSRNDAPTLMPEHLRALSRTYPAPPWSPDAALYLHGTPNSPADVNVAWRADLPSDSLEPEVRRVAISAILEYLPIRSSETVALPIGVVRRWLRGQSPGDVADVELDITRENTPAPNAISAWRIRNADDDVELVTANSLRPGNTIVVAAAASGCDRFGWNPRMGAQTGISVSDVAAEASLPYAKSKYGVRIHPELLAQELDPQLSTETESAYRARLESRWKPISDVAAAYGHDPKAMIDALYELVPERWRPQLDVLRNPRGRITIEYPYGGRDDDDLARFGFLLIAKRGVTYLELQSAQLSQLESATETSTIGSAGPKIVPLSLADHSHDIEAHVRGTAERLGLERFSEDLCVAAFLHDVGKADGRFQEYLAGGPWHQSDVLAKSGRRRTRTEDRAIRRAANLPPEWRHEALSVRIAREHPRFATANDPELVLWLIGTHHGFGRPLFDHDEPRDDEAATFAILDETLNVPPSAGPQRIDFTLRVPSSDGTTEVDWATMFARLEERYGAWGLAWLESIVRLADHRVSEAPGTHGERPA